MKAAAERYMKPYPRASVSSGKDYTSQFVHVAEWNDMCSLAQAMCDCIAADEAERSEREKPIDEQWLRESCELIILIDGPGFAWKIEGTSDAAHSDLWLILWDDASGGFWYRDDDGKEWIGTPASWKFTNRGQLIDLLRALGVGVKK